jgi:hypothetical protein
MLGKGARVANPVQSGTVSLTVTVREEMQYSPADW